VNLIRVRQQIDQDPGAGRFFVGEHHEGQHVRPPEAQIVPLGGGLKTEHANDDREALKPNLVEIQPARLDFRCENSRRSARKMIALRRTTRTVTRAAWEQARYPPSSQLSVAADGIQRRPQFMDEPDDISALGRRCGGFGDFLGALQLGVGTLGGSRFPGSAAWVCRLVSASAARGSAGAITNSQATTPMIIVSAKNTFRARRIAGRLST